MKKLMGLVVFLFVLGAASTSFAKPEKGWHTGAYTLLGIGFINMDEDTNVTNGAAFGNANILGYGLTFGWNFLDFLATELQMRYGTETAGGAREHAANVDFLLKYSLILDALTRNETFRFLPYAKAGAGISGAAVPAGGNRFGVWGYGAVLGTGLEVPIKNWIYTGLDFNLHLISLQSKNNAAGTRILNGGFDPQYSVWGYFGVHF